MNIVFNIYYQKYRYGFRVGSYSGFIRGFCAQPIAPYLTENSHLATATFERLSRTRAFMHDAICYGLNDDRVKTHIEHIKKSHAHITLGNEHFLYIAANLVIDPLRALKQFGKKRLTQEEKIAFLHFWEELCNAINITDAPSSLRAWINFRNLYERQYEGYSKEQTQLLEVCLNEALKVSLPSHLQKPFYYMLPWLIPQRMRHGFNIKTHKRGLVFLTLLKFT